MPEKSAPASREPLPMPCPRECPFCANTRGEVRDLHDGTFAVHCRGLCESVGPSASTKADAIESWNTRVGSSSSFLPPPTSEERRDAERWVTEELSRALRLLPQLRLGQLIVNVLPERLGNDPYSIKDDRLATAITGYVGRHVPCEIAKPGLCHFGKDHQGPCGRFIRTSSYDDPKSQPPSEGTDAKLLDGFDAICRNCGLRFAKHPPERGGFKCPNASASFFDNRQFPSSEAVSPEETDGANRFAGWASDLLSAELRKVAPYLAHDRPALLIACANRIDALYYNLTTATADDARLAALTEVHEFYEFDATTEEQFDEWLHARIKEIRVKLGLSAASPGETPVTPRELLTSEKLWRCTSGCAGTFTHEESVQHYNALGHSFEEVSRSPHREGQS